MSSLTVLELALWRRSRSPFTLRDVRRGAERAENGDGIAGGRWLDAAALLDRDDNETKR
jgi:hypothetical protein